MGISAQELRIGNLIEYKIKDKLDERKEWWEISKVDFQDLIWLDSNPEDADFRPIKLTEEWLLKFGFVKVKYEHPFLNHTPFERGDFHVKIYNEINIIKIWYGNVCIKNNYFSLHELQNLYYSITGLELTQVSEGKNKNFV